MKDDVERLMVDEAALHGLMRNHVAWISECLAGGDRDNWNPTLAVLVKTGPDDVQGEVWMHVLAVPFNEHEEKHGAMREIGGMLYAKRKFPVAAVMSAECWMSKQRGGTKALHCEPRHDPARREAIQISGMTLGGKDVAFTFALVERDEKQNMKVAPFGEIVKGGELPLLQSLFMGFFAEPLRKAGREMR